MPRCHSSSSRPHKANFLKDEKEWLLESLFVIRALPLISFVSLNWFECLIIQLPSRWKRRHTLQPDGDSREENLLCHLPKHHFFDLQSFQSCSSQLFLPFFFGCLICLTQPIGEGKCKLKITKCGNCDKVSASKVWKETCFEGFWKSGGGRLQGCTHE